MMGSCHVGALQALGYPVFMVMGRDIDRTKQFAAAHGIKHATTDFKDIVEAGVEVVHVCTPPVRHYPLVRRALEQGMHVICEKPFVFDETEGEELVRLALEKNVINAVGFNVRFHGACRDARTMVRKKELGQILLVNGSYMQEFHALPSFYSWRYETESAGKFLATTEIGSHWIDLMRYLTGEEVIAVSATYGHFFPDRTIKDGMQFPAGSVEGKPFHTDADNVALVAFRLGNGALASMTLSEITPGRYNYLDVTVTGSDRSFWWNSEDLNRLHIGRKNQCVEEKVFAFGDGFNDSVTNMLREVYRDIEQGRRSDDAAYATFADGLMNTKICNAIYESARNNAKWEEIR